jgi:aconitate hydratase
LKIGGLLLSSTLAEKILRDHLVSGNMVPGEEIAIKIDYTLTQDSTGTMAYLQFEAMGVPRVKTKKSVAYIDHNMLQTGFENADDHKVYRDRCQKARHILQPPGQRHLPPGASGALRRAGRDAVGLGQPHAHRRGIGMIAIGAGGLDVAVAMAGGPYYITMPKILGIELKGKLPFGVSAKDIILEVLRRLSVKGGVGRIIEYFGEGVATLSVPERATITNMGAELGATTSIFPSDEVTRAFLKPRRAARRIMCRWRLTRTRSMMRLSPSNYPSWSRWLPCRTARIT